MTWQRERDTMESVVSTLIHSCTLDRIPLTPQSYSSDILIHSDTLIAHIHPTLIHSNTLHTFPPTLSSCSSDTLIQVIHGSLAHLEIQETLSIFLKTLARTESFIHRVSTLMRHHWTSMLYNLFMNVGFF